MIRDVRKTTSPNNSDCSRIYCLTYFASGRDFVFDTAECTPGSTSMWTARFIPTWIVSIQNENFESIETSWSLNISNQFRSQNHYGLAKVWFNHTLVFGFLSILCCTCRNPVFFGDCCDDYCVDESPVLAFFDTIRSCAEEDSYVPENDSIDECFDITRRLVQISCLSR